MKTMNVIKWIPIISESKADNGRNGSEFERQVTAYLNGESYPWLNQDAINCAKYITDFLVDKGYNTQSMRAEQCGGSVNTERGDIKVFIGDKRQPKEIRLEMKYVTGKSSGTWHNTSPNMLKVICPNQNFTTVKSEINRTITPEALLSGDLNFQINDDLSFTCKGTFFESLDACLEPFWKNGIIPRPNNASSPFTIEERRIIKNNSTVALFKKGNSLYAKSISDTWGIKKPDLNLNSSEKIDNASFWRFTGKSDVCKITPAMVYKKVMVYLGKSISHNILEQHFSILEQNPECKALLLSSIIDKIKSADGVAKGYPDYLVVYSRNSKSNPTSIFNCSEFAENNDEEPELVKKSILGYYIGNATIGFTCQYSWGNGTFINNPVIRIFKKH